MASRDEMEAIAGFVESFGVQDFEHIIDEAGVVWDQYGIRSQPAFAFINDDGTVETNVGALGVERLSEAAEQLIAA